MNKRPFRLLITGITRGLGLCLAEYFLHKGHTVFGLGRWESEGVLRLKKEYGGRFLFFIVDITDETKISDTFGMIKNITGSIDILINNAAVHFEQHKPDIHLVDFSVYVETFKVNSIAPLMVVRSFLPLLKKGRKKCIVNISSEAGSIGNAWRKAEYSYCMSKAALNMASKILQTRLKEDGIKVLAVHPGWFSSDMGGPEAPITPRDAAEQVAKTILKEWPIDDPIYMDAEGKEMPW
jgi:NAD(P)-dependent dehydrogenase (short-subunit alcohol dehydrogenase family)